MKFGFAKKNITPSFPVPLAGYMVDGEAGRISEGVHDKLYARALFFSDAQNAPLALLQLDLLCVDNKCLEKIYSLLKDGAEDVPPLNKENILVCSAHTHSGFGGIFDMEHGMNRELVPLFGKETPALIELVVQQSVRAITEAARNCVETKVRMNKGSIAGLGTNRRNVELPYDDSLFVMELLRGDGKKALLYNLSCHPTVMNGKNLLVSADFPGSVAENLETVSNGYDMVVFVNGSAGDMSTRFTRNESSFKECDRYAEMIINGIRNLTKDDFVPLTKMELRYHTVSLKKACLPSLGEAEANVKKTRQKVKDALERNANAAETRKAESFVEGAEIMLRKARSAESRASQSGEPSLYKTVEIAILTINATVVLCSPFELFSTLALTLKRKKAVECFGYVNSLEGYLADCDAFDAMDYEALSSDFEKGEGERYIELMSILL